MSLALIDIKTGKPHYLLPFSYQPIGFISIKKDIVYFTATQDILDRLFAFDMTTGKLSVLNNSSSLYGEVGNYEPAIGNKKIAWVWFSADGYAIHETDNSKLKWGDLEQGKLGGSLSDMGITALKRDSAAGSIGNDRDRAACYHQISKIISLV